MAKVIFAPNKLDKNKFTVFLAGSIDILFILMAYL